MPENVGDKELTLQELANKLNEFYVAKGEKTLELLEEKRKEVVASDPNDLAQKEKHISELEASLSGLPNVAKETVVEKIESLKNEVKQKKAVSADIIDNHINAVKERLAFLRIYGF